MRGVQIQASASTILWSSLDTHIFNRNLYVALPTSHQTRDVTPHLTDARLAMLILYMRIFRFRGG